MAIRQLDKRRKYTRNHVSVRYYDEYQGQTASVKRFTCGHGAVWAYEKQEVGLCDVCKDRLEKGVEHFKANRQHNQFIRNRRK